MSELSNDKIIAALKAAGVNAPCPRCRNTNFTLMDGYITHPIQSDFQSFNIGGPSLPAVMTVCNQCGFLAQHALGVLNLLPKPPEEETKK